MNTLQYLRQFRIGPYPVFDTALGYLGIYLLAPLLTKLMKKINISVSRAGWLWFMLPLSVVFHLFFHQNTPFMKQLVHPPEAFIGGAVLLGMVCMGLRESKHLKPWPTRTAT